MTHLSFLRFHLMPKPQEGSSPRIVDQSKQLVLQQAIAFAEHLHNPVEGVAMLGELVSRALALGVDDPVMSVSQFQSNF